MCGILGGNIKNWDYEKGIMAIKHRGPDAQRVIKNPLCTLGFARLAIMDLSMDAMQPMDSVDGSVTILFNGEIYGYRKLRDKLKAKYPFRTTSDTEVILYAYLEYGDRFIDQIDGMFAIAIYDRRVEMLKLYRDRYGIKPLYYYCHDEEFAFASELKAFTAASEGKKWTVDRTAILDFLCYQYIPEPKSIYEEVYKLKPACFLFYDLREKRIIKRGKYWKLHVCTRAAGNRNAKAIQEDVRELLAESVREQMVADVEVGTFLSGGIDSSIVTYESSRLNPNTTAYSIGFREKSDDESHYARLFAEKYHINQKLKTVSIGDVKGLNGRMREWYDEPFADTSAYPTYLVSKLAREDIKVVLTGDGGDEIFGGYGRYRQFFEHLSNHDVARTKAVDKALCRTRLEIPGKASQLKLYSGYIGVFDRELCRNWTKKYGIDGSYDTRWHLRKYYVPDLPPLTRARYLDFKTYLPGDILTKVDRTSMSVSLEARVPFLNRKLVEYVFGLAENECCSSDCLKRLLKEAYRGIVPDEILYRKKMGFSIPGSYIHVSSMCRTTYEKVLKDEWPELFYVDEFCG